MGLTVMLADFQQPHTLYDLWICQLTPSLARALSGHGSYRDTSLLRKEGTVNHQIQKFASHLIVGIKHNNDRLRQLLLANL